MKIFCSYAFTDENVVSVTSRMRAVVKALENQGHDVYCDRFDTELEDAQKIKDVKTIFNKAFKELGNSDKLVAIITSPNRSIGQLMEIGAAYNQNIPVYLFVNKSAINTSYLPDLANKTIWWDSEEELISKLGNINSMDLVGIVS